MQRVTAVMIAGHGDRLPVSAFPVDGTWPTGTTRWEKRNIATEIPVWDPAICIQCNKCALVCPHAAIRAKVFEPALLDGAPADVQVRPLPRRRLRGLALHDPGGARRLHGLLALRHGLPGQGQGATRSTRRSTWRRSAPLRDAERENYAFFLDLPEPDRSRIRVDGRQGIAVRDAALRVLGGLRGLRRDPVHQAADAALRRPAADRQRDRLLLDLRRQPADDALHRQPRRARPGLVELALRGQRGVRPRHAPGARQPDGPGATSPRGSAPSIGETLVAELLEADQSTKPASRRSASACGAARASRRVRRPARRGELELLADDLVRKSVWIVGGDGWAYDIGYGGLDHVLSLAPRRQHPRARHRGLLEHRRPAVEGDAARRRRQVRRRRGKETRQEGPGPHGHELRARLRRARRRSARKDAQTVKAFQEAESYPGPSLIIAYSHCIAHGYDLAFGCEQQKLAVDSGSWPLYRFDPRRVAQGRAAARSSTRARRRSGREVHAEREPLPHGRGGRSRALRGACRARRARPQRRLALYQHLSDWQSSRAGPERRAAADLAAVPRRRRRDHGPFDRRTSASTCRIPLMPGASPLVDDLDMVERLEDAGAAAIVMHSLFEEQIVGEELATATPSRRPASRTPRRSATCPIPPSSPSAPTSTSSSSAASRRPSPCP